MLTKFSTKFTGDKLDKSVELIFDNCEEKIEAKNIKKWGIMLKWKSSAYSQDITYNKKIQSGV